MSGGPQRLEAREYEPPQPVTLVLSQEEREWDSAMRFWNRARKFRQRVEQVTRRRGISFARWQVLEVTARLIREKRDAVSQRDVSQRAQLPKSSVSEAMWALSWGGLVDIRPDAWGVFDRIWMTEKGNRLIASLRGELAEVARAIGAQK